MRVWSFTYVSNTSYSWNASSKRPMKWLKSFNWWNSSVTNLSATYLGDFYFAENWESDAWVNVSFQYLNSCPVWSQHILLSFFFSSLLIGLLSFNQHIDIKKGVDGWRTDHQDNGRVEAFSISSGWEPSCWWCWQQFLVAAASAIWDGEL